MSHKNPWAAAWAEGILSLASWDSQWGWRKGVVSTDWERGLIPQREGRSLLPILILPRPVCTCPCPFYPAQCSLFPASSAHSQTLRAGPFLLNSSVSRQLLLPPPGDETELAENPPPLFSPTSGKGFGQGTQDLSLNSTPIYRSSKRNKVLCSA